MALFPVTVWISSGGVIENVLKRRRSRDPVEARGVLSVVILVVHVMLESVQLSSLRGLL